ncbi:MAG: Antibiotic biosynthesis monooxygenase [Chloroflexi bacterium]|jgi:quinol monooxygenase YgiN|nr:Antibiotic biosynthesis monooxygenase [Chloroflexota bacterium]
MVVLVARYYAIPGKGDAVEQALKEMAPKVKELEPGCLMYQVSRSHENADHFLLYEQYQDMAALEAHRETAHFKEIIGEKISPLVERRERGFYNLVIS